MTRRIRVLRSIAGALALVLAWSGPATGQMSNFVSLSDAEGAAARIMDAAGLRTVDFLILVDEGSNNAAAGIPEGGPAANRRVIIYDPLFLQEIERRAGEWGPMSVMAHEVAHHLLGHTVFGAGSNPPDELDADFYTGFILNRLGARLGQAQAGVRLVASTSGSSSHPARDERMEAIALGWNKAGEGVAVSAGQGLEELKEELRRAEGRLRDSEGRFREAEDRYRRAESERQEALEQLRQGQAQGRLTEERRRAMEARVQASEGRLQEAEADRDEALTELESLRDRAADALVRADRAFALAVLLIPLVLVALLLAMRKPRREVVKVIERITRRHAGPDGRRGPWRQEGGLSDARAVPGGREGGGMPRTIPPAPAFDGSGLERCAERGGFVLGSDPYLVDAVVDHPSVSRRHARLTRHRGRVRIEDLHSVNGTRVNGRPVERFVPTELAPRDEVTLGAVNVAVALWGRLGTAGPETLSAFPTSGKDMP